MIAAGLPSTDEMLRAIEDMAVELATLAGAEIVAALGTMPAARYKTMSLDETVVGDPVSEVDRKVETLIRARLAEAFPEHQIVGEEFDQPGRRHDYVWAVDPVDGTANFVNGFPLFAASIGVLRRGRPVPGAIWYATTHRLRSGVYHAREGGPLCFDGTPIAATRNPTVRRGLAGLPDAARRDGGPWEVRRTGSAAIECALVAAGILQVARFEGPHLWDVAGGIALVRAAGGEARVRSGGEWVALERFEIPAKGGNDPAGLRRRRGALVVGRPDAVATMCRATTSARARR